jgi:hypothetical protein
MTSLLPARLTVGRSHHHQPPDGASCGAGCRRSARPGRARLVAGSRLVHAARAWHPQPRSPGGERRRPPDRPGRLGAAHARRSRPTGTFHAADRVGVTACPAHLPAESLSGLAGVSLTTVRVSQPANSPTGTLTRKMARQPTASTAIPPGTGPAASPMPLMPPHTLSARACAAGSGNWCTISAKEQGSDAAAPSQRGRGGSPVKQRRGSVGSTISREVSSPGCSTRGRAPTEGSAIARRRSSCIRSMLVPAHRAPSLGGLAGRR